MRFVGRGHPAIRATHSKTLEISRDEEITERATCVIAVGARPQPAQPMAGPVRVVLRVGEQSSEISCRANPSWDPAGPAVIRRSPLRLPGTFATHADAAAADLPRGFVAALQSADATIEVTVDLLPTDRPTIVLFAADPSRPNDPRLRAELDAADAVIAEDDGARALLPPGTASRPTANPGRTLVVATADLPGARMWTDLDAAATDPPGARMWTDLKRPDIDVVGLPAPLAAAAASPTRGPVLLGTASDPADLIRTAPATARLVVRANADQLPALLDLARQARGTSGATIAQNYTPSQRVTADEPVELPSRDIVYICFDAAEPSDAIDPTVRAAIDGLLAAGVATKATADTLATLTGWDRRRAYDTVLSWRGQPPACGS